MNIKEIYKSLVGIVCRATGIDESSMFNSNKEECVDARSILIYILIKKNFTENEVSKLTGLTQQCVNHLKNTFHSREKKWSVTTNLHHIDNEFTMYLQSINSLSTHLL